MVEFYQAGLEHLGAVCERSWFDRLQVVAEARAAKVWNDDGAFMETELHFPEPDAIAPRDAGREVFPGCPLTFRLSEAVFSGPLCLERAILAVQRSQAPIPEVAEKLWHAQVSESDRWQIGRTFLAKYHFSLLALVRCEIQAIDQHWSTHRLAITLPGGVPDESLAAEWDFAELDSKPASEPEWPNPSPAELKAWLETGVRAATRGELENIQKRQQEYLQRELSRIGQYFSGYELELTSRADRSQNETTRLKTKDRLAAAQAEHARRRADQIQRHEIRIIPRVDALSLVAEPAWQTQVTQHLALFENAARFVAALQRFAATQVGVVGGF